MRICHDKPGVCYVWKKCTKKFLGSCTKYIWVEEFYDLSDPNVRAKLIDQGWRVRKD